MWRVVSSTVLTAHRDPGRLRHAIINGYGLPRQANEPIEILTEGLDRYLIANHWPPSELDLISMSGWQHVARKQPNGILQ